MVRRNTCRTPEAKGSLAFSRIEEYSKNVCDYPENSVLQPPKNSCWHNGQTCLTIMFFQDNL